MRFKLNKDYRSGLTVNTLPEFDSSYESVRLGPFEEFQEISRDNVIAKNAEVDISKVKVIYLGE
ncbi:hypothetical protein BU202_01940 [Streptococcus cuniculi]|uniref:Uncharacterized protein n=1 Tax=Streptococcus cuniculi TaxID=1432788 RepID=A0A1Q8E9D7_9STRE|nr:hypothetical protein [Streptococcus cuniculi]OLF48403.1 hypothetical protein BU202_01940 [Streptococcus cuniculi]